MGNTNSNNQGGLQSDEFIMQRNTKHLRLVYLYVERGYDMIAVFGIVMNAAVVDLLVWRKKQKNRKK